MIRFIDNKLIIEIDCKNSNPANELFNITDGLKEIVSLIDSYNGLPEKINWSLTQLSKLLKEMSFNENQLNDIYKLAIKNKDLKTILS